MLAPNAVRQIVAHAKSCRQCGAPLVEDWQERPRLRKKVLLRTDFVAASRANQRATRRLVLMLLLILVVLGYLLGWSRAGAVRLLSPADSIESIWFLSDWGTCWWPSGCLCIGALWSWFSFRRGDRIILRMTGANEVSGH